MKTRAFLVRVLLVLGVAPATARAATEPKQECAAAADDGQNQRDQGRYRAAREAFVSCAREVCPKLISQACGGWLRDLDAATPTVVLGARDQSGVDLTDVRVTLDGAPLVRRLDGKAVAIDPGAHTLRFERPGEAPVEQGIVARSGEKNRLVVVELRPAEGPAPTPIVAEPIAAAAAPGSTGEIATGTVLFALAAGSAATAAYLIARSSHDDTAASQLRAGLPSDYCTHATSSLCTTLGDEVDAQHRDALAGGVLLGGAGALALSAVATLLLWPHPDARTARIVPSLVSGGGALTVAGAF